MAAKLHASWAHGFTAVPENPATRVLRQGFGATFTIPANTGEWIHLPIPTPVITANARAVLDKVLFLFHARNTSSLLQVDVYDGPTRILAVREMRIRGDHSRGVDDKNVVTLRRPAIRFGVGVSLLVAAGQNQSEFFVSGFGGDFFHDLP
ncbi:hypothetical protein Misp01_42320 [Microtetraspora sp. NBRC 13810]|uniref:DUF6623 family protein n=1 Tax=Microtetraspora sp. NBRC 13810 TaxID=3030990 RepID=UPI0024A11A94|nr:DUF6623 family protein [Microtetraspora sp. NBRC 13810]GLW09103.1 hypothetical protein Misp01_42320 [Microtetraspora sp. NBRC 13810]